MTVFAELVAATNFSFLRGASHAHEMVGQAAGADLVHECREYHGGGGQDR